MDTVPILPADFQRFYGELLPQISDYGWMWRLLSRRASKNGWFPRRLHAIVRRFGKPSTPYFIGQTGDGIRFLGDYRDEYSATCQVCPDYDGLLLRFMQQRMCDLNGAYLDIGSNMGVTAATMAKFLQGRAEVIAFEPVAETARRAAATFALNNLTNMQLFQAAVGDSNEEIRFFAVPGRSEWASANRTEQKLVARWVETRVPCRSLDSLVADGTIGKVGLIKVDVEGHEPKVMEGARCLLGSQRPDVIFEYNTAVAPAVGWKPSDVETLLRNAADYHCQVLHWDNTLADFPFPDGQQGVFNIYGSCACA